jgi:hypothetical protein
MLLHAAAATFYGIIFLVEQMIHVEQLAGDMILITVCKWSKLMKQACVHVEQLVGQMIDSIYTSELNTIA